MADAVQRGSLSELKDELGDLLLQVVFHARMAEEQEAFDFQDVVASISDKMVRRHPHVFADEKIESADAQTAAWEAQKARERASRERGGLLDDVPLALPALTRAEKMGKRASRVGFDWPAVEGVINKVSEELNELESARVQGDGDAVAEELGDLLFSITSLARHLKVDPEEALRQANRKFGQRFAQVEAMVAKGGGDWDEFTPEELDGFWERAKRAEEN